MADLSRYFSKDNTSAARVPLSAGNTGLENLAPGLSAVADAAVKVQANDDDIQRRDDDFWTRKTALDADGETDGILADAMENVGDDPTGFGLGVMDRVQQVHDRMMEAAPSRRAAQALDLEFQSRRQAIERRAAQFEAEQKIGLRARTIQQQADNLAQHAARDPGVPAFSPHGGPISPSADGARIDPASVQGDFVSTDPSPEGRYNIEGWNSQFYSPRDFADGAHIGDRTGGVKISREVVAKLDWVTAQFGQGKLQINSGYRSPQSNLERAKSGRNGPHTTGKAIDIQVRDLDQGEKNRLYSLLKVQGFNAFGFGNGALHAEIRDGEGNGRGGDFEWTYKGAEKYSLVPVLADGGVPVGSWKTANQYPHLALAQISARAETGKGDLASASITIVDDAGGTRSYGIFGLNSGGTLQAFVRDNPELGLTETPGSPNFDVQWTTLAASDQNKLIQAQLEWHEKRVVRPAQRSLTAAGFGGISNDPRAIGLVADMIVQYGRAGVTKHLEAAAGTRTPEQFIAAVSESARDSLDTDFRTALEDNPDLRKGLLNRIAKRERAALSIAYGGGRPNGNVPAWNGPVPQISDVPEYAQRLARIEGLLETMGGTPLQRAEARDKMMRHITRGWLTALADHNPSAAMAALHSGQYDDALQLADQEGIERGAETEWKVYENQIRDSQKRLTQELRAETARIVADEAAALAATGQGLGQIGPRHEGVMTESERETLDLAEFQHQIGEQIRTAHVDELPGILEQLEPSGDGFALEQKKFDYAQKLIADRLTSQQNDPAGYVVASSEAVGNQWRAAIASGQSTQIQAAVRALRSTQLEQGIPAHHVRSLTQSSQTRNIELLKPETADQAFANYNEMRNLYGAEFGAVLEEMERDGGPAGWSDVHKLVESGQAVLAKSLARIVHANKFGDSARVGVRMAAQGAREVARSIFDGQVNLIEAPSLKISGRSEDGESQDEIMGRVMGDAFDHSPTVMRAARQAALSFYANDSRIGEELDTERLEAAVQAVTGGVLEHNGDGQTGRFLAPAPGVTQRQFDWFVGMIRDSDLKGAFIGYSDTGAEVTRAMLHDRLQFVSAGNGIYNLRYPGAGLARDRDGAPFELDMRRLMPVLAERRRTGAGKTLDVPAGGPLEGIAR